MPNAPQLVEQIRKYLGRPTTLGLRRLVPLAFRFQYDRNEPFRRLCQARGVDRVESWRDIPAIPVSAYRAMRLATDQPQEIFRSSGTTSGSRSVHSHPYPELYRSVIDTTFEEFCWPFGGAAPPMLSLISDREHAPDSSLSFMIEHVLRTFGAADSCWAFGRRGVELETADRWCREHRQADRPVMILATSFALAQLLDDGVGCKLPAGSVLFETGGFKGRSRELSRSDLLAAVERSLGIAESGVVREYGMTELTSQFYTQTLSAGDSDRFVGPPWLKAQVLDPQTLEEVPDDESGVIAVFDLANIGSSLRLLTEDLGRCDGYGFRLLGRAPQAPLRGCSLVVEELMESR